MKLWREYCCSHTSHIHLERYELKSIVGNTLLLFRASIQYKIIAFVKEDKEEKRKAEEGVGIK